MIIAITSTGQKLDSGIDQRFGRTKFIILYNTEDSSFECYDNDLNLNAAQGAGIQTAQKIVENDANILLTGNLGPKAFRVLEAGSIKAFSTTDKNVEEAIQSFQNGKLNELTNPNVEEHWS